MSAMDRTNTFGAEPRRRLGKERFVIRMDRDHDASDAGIGEEGLERVTQNGLAADQAILLRPLGGLACALATPGGNDDGSDFSRRARRSRICLGKDFGLVHLLVHRADA